MRILLVTNHKIKEAAKMSAKKSFLILSLIIFISSICGTTKAATPADINEAIEDGIAWLVDQQDSSGAWYNSECTGLALIALQERAFELGYTPFDPCYPYKENVEKGFECLFNAMEIISISTQPAGNPDTDDDGNGVRVNTGYSIRATGIAMTAIAVSRSLEREVNSLYSDVNGWTYKEVLVDMVDYMAFGQVDTGSYRGGWGNSHCDDAEGRADNPNSGYAVLGLGYAESLAYGFNCTIPQFVKDELNQWINYIQSDDGGSGHSSPETSNPLATGSLIFEMAFVGRRPSDPNLQRALKYLGHIWRNFFMYHEGIPDETQFCVMRGLKYAGIDKIVIDGSPRNWYADFADLIIGVQRANGSWSFNYYGSGDIMPTEWALLTLEKTAPARMPSLDLNYDIGGSGCVEPGNLIAYRIDYNYPADPNFSNINDVIIIDYLPPDIDFNDASAGGLYDSNNHTVTWTISTLSPGESGFLTLTVEVRPLFEPGGAITNCCELKSGNINYNTSYEYTQICYPQPHEGRIYVDANVSECNDFYNKGTSWQCPYTKLQDALWNAQFALAASPSVDIWVAAGTYKPDVSSADPNGSGFREYAFKLSNNVALYGGFPPSGGPWESRDPDVYETILSGDIDSNDSSGLSDPNRGGNSCHVVTSIDVNQTAILDGFTITAGNANDEEYKYNSHLGGGMYNYTGCPVINDCTFSDNRVTASIGGACGGGMYNSNASPVVTNCTFSENYAGACNPGGGGIYNYSGSPMFINCIFNENSTPSEDYCGGLGGGMYNDDANSTVINCTFSGNSASVGGGMRNYWGNLTVKNCTFCGNIGGGMYNYISNSTITNCTFNENTANKDSACSGGIYDQSGNPTVTNCTFVGNKARSSGSVTGGGMYIYYGNPTVTNCTFVGNKARSSGSVTGGGMYIYGGIYRNRPLVANCTFVGNKARSSGSGAGGGMYGIYRNGSLVTNCTFIGNRAYSNSDGSPQYGSGGGVYMYNRLSSDTNITNCTLSGNFAYDPYGYYGGGIYSYSERYDANVTNCILWANEGEQILDYYGTVFVTYSDIQGGWPGDGNIDADPCFVDLGYWHPYKTPNDVNDDFWVNGNYRLLPNSPCIDAGDLNYSDPNHPNDLDGNPRIVGGRIDMGAYEFPSDYCVHIGDFDNSCRVDFKDFAIFALAWLEFGDSQWISDCDISLPADGIIDEKDLQIFAENWLAGVE